MSDSGKYKPIDGMVLSQDMLIGENVIHIDEIAAHLDLFWNQVNIVLLMEWFDHRVSL